MVARLSELPAPWFADTVADPDTTSSAVGTGYVRPAPNSQLLLDRASSLAGVSARGRGIQGITGTPLRLDESLCRNNDHCFIAGRVFAVINAAAVVRLRLPRAISDDLIDNGLATRAGKHVLTWPAESAYQLAVNWRVVLHAYWNITDYSSKHARRMWSEWVIEH